MDSWNRFFINSKVRIFKVLLIVIGIKKSEIILLNKVAKTAPTNPMLGIKSNVKIILTPASNIVTKANP